MTRRDRRATDRRSGRMPASGSTLSRGRRRDRWRRSTALSSRVAPCRRRGSLTRRYVRVQNAIHSAIREDRIVTWRAVNRAFAGPRFDESSRYAISGARRRARRGL